MKYKNNPFNIRKGSSHWLGSISKLGDKFETFDTLEHGIRAFFIIMRTYSVKYGRNTIRSIITRFAPPSENNISSYISFVSRKCNIRPDTKLTSCWSYIIIAQAMAIYESNTFLPVYNFQDVWRYFHISNDSFPDRPILESKDCTNETFDDLPF